MVDRTIPPAEIYEAVCNNILHKSVMGIPEEQAAENLILPPPIMF